MPEIRNFGDPRVSYIKTNRWRVRAYGSDMEYSFGGGRDIGEVVADEKSSALKEARKKYGRKWKILTVTRIEPAVYWR